ncbi:hypothetical protein QAD02_012034 [Eretmocerus hayati]|uniref:Uncharacterized protein n=1 Tax=Eretmocerus hayati TaxID=131215 RepID=A0ACC2NZD9_9HYME|nr:hypothetical protein QAD02_012034 [Eretmocerus hayati]
MQQRCICTCAKLQAAYKQVGRFVNKVLSSDKTKRSFKRPSSHQNQELFQGPKTLKTSETHQTRRQNVLNQIFMKHVTDLLSTGEVAPQLLERNFEITGVQVSTDYSVVNVSWAAPTKIDDDEQETTEEILRKAAGHLQHELSRLRVIGLVPPINFVRDKKYALIRDVDSILSQIDFGADYVPTTYVHSQKDVPTLITSLSPEVKERLSKMESKNGEEVTEEEEEEYEIEVPEMRQDVIGFDHSTVMKKVRGSLNKARDAHQRRMLNLSPELTQPAVDPVTSDEVASFLSKKEETALFDEFLKKRLLDEKRRQRAMPLLQSKRQDEEAMSRILNEEYEDDLDISDNSQEDYEDENSYR